MTTDRLLLVKGYNSSSEQNSAIKTEFFAQPEAEIVTNPFEMNENKKSILMQDKENTASDVVMPKRHRSKRHKINQKQIFKAYKHNPKEAIKELGFDFSKEEFQELQQYIDSKKELKAFLKFAENENLSDEDVFAGYKAARKHPRRNWFQRLTHGAGMLLTHPMEAFDYWNSETEYIAKKSSETMGEIRELRDDFSSEAVAEISVDCVDRPEQKARSMHYVGKRDIDGSFVYNEQASMNAHRYMLALDEEHAEIFVANTVELEAIKTPDGHIKYKGETIVSTGIKETEHPDLKDTIFLVAQKKDTTDEYLTNTTDNLCQNPDMEDAIRFTVTAKAQDGSDRFSAKDVNSCSNYLVDKSKDTCQSYTADLKVLSNNNNLTGSNIIDLNEIIQDNPQNRNEILSRASDPNTSGNDIVDYCRTNYSSKSSNSGSSCTESSGANSGATTVTSSETTTSNNTNSATNDDLSSKYLSKNQNNEQTATALITENTIDTIENVSTYKRAEIYKALTEKFGSMNANKIMNNLENRNFIELMKKYGKDKKIREAIIEAPDLVAALTKDNNLSSSELADILTFCNNNKKTMMAMRGLLGLFTPSQAITYLRRIPFKEELDTILESTMSKAEKKEKVRNLAAI